MGEPREAEHPWVTEEQAATGKVPKGTEKLGVVVQTHIPSTLEG